MIGFAAGLALGLLLGAGGFLVLHFLWFNRQDRQRKSHEQIETAEMKAHDPFFRQF